MGGKRALQRKAFQKGSRRMYSHCGSTYPFSALYPALSKAIYRKIQDLPVTWTDPKQANTWRPDAAQRDAVGALAGGLRLGRLVSGTLQRPRRRLSSSWGSPERVPRGEARHRAGLGASLRFLKVQFYCLWCGEVSQPARAHRLMHALHHKGVVLYSSSQTRTIVGVPPGLNRQCRFPPKHRCVWCCCQN